MPEFKYAGTVNHGTLRNQDLGNSFLRLLREMGKEIDKDLEQGVKASNREPLLWETEAGNNIVEKLMEQLDREAPEGYYFGVHPGDGSDFGFWESALLSPEWTEKKKS